VPDEVWDEAARHYDQQGLAALIIEIELINVFNRVQRRDPADRQLQLELTSHRAARPGDSELAGRAALCSQTDVPERARTGGRPEPSRLPVSVPRRGVAQPLEAAR
jgi:hypothetical protein